MSQRRKPLLIIIGIALLFGIPALLCEFAPYIRQFQIDQRVARVIHMYPGAELVRTIVKQKEEGFDRAKIFIYQTDDPIEDVVTHKFVVSDGSLGVNVWNEGKGTDIGLWRQFYFVSDFPQATLDYLMPVSFDFCCFGDDPDRLSGLMIYLILASTLKAANFDALHFAYGNIMLDSRDLPVIEKGTLIIYGYRFY
jgi:hypothetical protein